MEDNSRIYPKCFVNYNVKSFPKILYILFDLNFKELSINKSKILYYVSDIICLEKEIKYSLLGLICTLYCNNFNCIVYNYHGK